MRIIFYCILLYFIFCFSSCTRDALQRPNAPEYIHVTIDTLPNNYNWDLIPDSVYSETTLSPTLQNVIDYYYDSTVTFHSTVIGTSPNNSFPKVVFFLQYNSALGSYPLGNFMIWFSPTKYIMRKYNNCNVTFSEIGTPGFGYLKGNFTVQCAYPPSVIDKTIVCNFNVLRN